MLATFGCGGEMIRMVGVGVIWGLGGDFWMGFVLILRVSLFQSLVVSYISKPSYWAIPLSSIYHLADSTSGHQCVGACIHICRECVS